MTTYAYYELDVEEPIIITKDEILEQYYDLWKFLMIKKFGEASELITEENCIEDWLTIHWAWSLD